MTFCSVSHRSLLNGDDEPKTLPYAITLNCPTVDFIARFLEKNNLGFVGDEIKLRSLINQEEKKREEEKRQEEEHERMRNKGGYIVPLITILTGSLIIGYLFTGFF